MTPSIDPQPQPLAPREILLATLLIAAGWLTEMAIFDSFALIGRVPWLDEVLTLLIVTDPSIQHAWTALSSGVDTNTPSLHAILRLISTIVGGHELIVMRVFALVCTGLALVGFYVVLRQALSILPAAIGVIVMAQNPLVVHNAFEGRFYAALVAATVWTAFLLHRMQHTRRPGVLVVVTGIVCALLCTLHYFGIFSLVCIVAGILYCEHTPLRQRIGRLLPALAGVLAVAACAPLAMQQRQAMSIATWIDPLSMRQVRAVVQEVLPIWPLLLVVLLLLLYRLVCILFPRLGKRPAPEPIHSRQLAPVFALIGVVLIVLILSIVMQPAFIGRYMIAAVPAGAAFVAWLSLRFTTPMRWVTLVLLIGLSVCPRPLRWDLGWTMIPPPMQKTTKDDMRDDRRIRQLAGKIRQTEPAPVLFQRRADLYPTAWIAPDLRDRLYFLDRMLPPDTPGEHFNIAEQDLARRVAEIYGWPRVMPAPPAASPWPYYIVDHNTNVVRVR